MRSAKIKSRIHFLFFIANVIGLTFLLTGCLIPGYAAHTPTPTKTPQSSKIAYPLNQAFDTPTMILYPSSVEAIAQSDIAPVAPAKTNTLLPKMPSATSTPPPLPTTTETFTPVPTPRPGEPTYTPTSTPISTPTPTATNTILPTPTIAAALTETPTETPALTPTETPTRAPTAPPMPVVSGGWNLVRFYEFTDESEDLHILGILENATGQAQESPTVIVTFRDEMGNEIVTDSESLELNIVPAGGRAPFHLLTFMEGHTTYDLSVEATPNDYPLRTDLEVSGIQIFLEDELYIVTGNIINPGARLEAYVEVAVALLGEADQIIGVGSTWILGQGLGSGQALSFRIEIDEFLDTAAGYDIVAVGG